MGAEISVGPKCKTCKDNKEELVTTAATQVYHRLRRPGLYLSRMGQCQCARADVVSQEHGVCATLDLHATLQAEGHVIPKGKKVYDHAPAVLAEEWKDASVEDEQPVAPDESDCEPVACIDLRTVDATDMVIERAALPSTQ